MKWVLTVFLLAGVFGILFANNIVRKNVIFEKVKDISLVQGKWTAITAISLNPYYDILNLLQTELTTVKNTLVQAIGDESKKLSATDTNQTIRMTPIFRLYQMRERFSVEINNFKVNRKYLEQEVQEIRFMHRRNTSAVIPIVGKVLSFLFGTLDEEDFSTIRSNVRQLANNQQQIKHVLTESMTFVKDNRQNIIDNRRTINEIITSLNESMNEQSRLGRELHVMQRFNDIYIRFDRTLSSLSEIVSVTRNHLQQLRLRLNMLSLRHLSPTVISPGDLRRLLLDISDQLPSYLKLPYDITTDLWFYYRILPCTTLIGDENLIIAMTIPLLDTNKRFELFKVHNHSVPNLKTNQSNLLAKYDIETEALAIDDVRGTFTTLSKIETNVCKKQHGNFCSINKSFYPVSSNDLCVVKIFLNNLQEIEKQCSVLVENKLPDPNAVTLREGKWLITSSKPLEINVKCGQNTQSKKN